MNKLETLKDIVADKYDGCYEVMRECVMAYANVDTNLLDCINNSRVLIRGVTEQMLPKAVFEVGDKVRHKVFGTGEIVKVDKVTQTYEIQFENIRGTRRLMFRAELGNVEN